VTQAIDAVSMAGARFASQYYTEASEIGLNHLAIPREDDRRRAENPSNVLQIRSVVPAMISLKEACDIWSQRYDTFEVVKNLVA
jgi:hypothetical protein